MILRCHGHLRCEHFISIDEVTEKSDVRVDEVERFMKNYVGIFTQPGVPAIVLEMRRVQMLSYVFVNLIFTNDSLEVVHGEKVRIVPSGSLEGY